MKNKNLESTVTFGRMGRYYVSLNSKRKAKVSISIGNTGNIEVKGCTIEIDSDGKSSGSTGTIRVVNDKIEEYIRL